MSKNRLSLLSGGGVQQDEEQVINIPLDELEDDPLQARFKINESHVLELAEQIRLHGFTVPIIVRPVPEGRGYYIMSGRHRRRAAELAGYNLLPAIERSVTEAQAMICIVDSNVLQRELPPSEKAWAYRMRQEAITKEGATDCRTTAEVAQQTGENIRQIQRYIKLTYLIPDFLEMVDEQTLSRDAGERLAALPVEDQNKVLGFVRKYGKVITGQQAAAIKNIDEITEDKLKAVFGMNIKKAAPQWKPGKQTLTTLRNYQEVTGKDDEGFARLLQELLEEHFSRQGESQI